MGLGVGSHSWVPSRKAWVLCEMGLLIPAVAFPLLCTGDAAAPTGLLPAPTEPKHSDCPGFGHWFWFLKAWSCNWTWEQPEVVLGNRWVTMVVEQE